MNQKWKKKWNKIVYCCVCFFIFKIENVLGVFFEVKLTYLNRSINPCTNERKLLCLVMAVSGDRAIFPKTFRFLFQFFFDSIRFLFIYGNLIWFLELSMRTQPKKLHVTHNSWALSVFERFFCFSHFQRRKICIIYVKHNHNHTWNEWTA